MTTFFLAVLAGTLSVLSPCVLPLLPLVFGAAASRGRAGPLFLAAGLTVSFVTIGMFVAVIGYGIGLDEGFFRNLAGVMMLVVGLVLAVPVLQDRFALAAGPASNWISEAWGGAEARDNASSGAAGQFGLGALLGAVWAPCIGPTLGAASVLAAQGERLGDVALVMVAFGLGTALPLLLLGLLSRRLLLAWRGRLLSAGGTLKTVMGVVFIVVAVSVLSGMDKVVEARLIDLSPEWLTTLTTRF
jgi:cytochrome c-type biogenesis protein